MIPDNSNPPRVMTVLGPVSPQEIGLCDAHSHVWIEPVPGGDRNAPQLLDAGPIIQELKEYRASGGSGIVDCQPGADCGRNGNMLARLASASGVHIVACTGFHLRRYYGPQAKLWELTAEEAINFFTGEIRQGLVETRAAERAVFPGFIKIAGEATMAGNRRELLKAAAGASKQTGYAIEMHTEKGSAVEEYLQFFIDQDLAPERLVFCHVDKRPDFALHTQLADAGAMLEYDTFYRPKYGPNENVWPLVERMVGAGYGDSLALATDMAESSMWRRMGGQPGLTAFMTQIQARLESMDLAEETIRKLLGGNIVRRLATAVD